MSFCQYLFIDSAYLYKKFLRRNSLLRLCYLALNIIIGVKELIKQKLKQYVHGL